MEEFHDILKSKLNDPAYDFRQESYLSFLKIPPRNYRESPTTKDYIDINENDILKMSSSIYEDNIMDHQEGYDIIIHNGFIKINATNGVSVRNLQDAYKERMNPVLYKIGKSREEMLINASWTSGSYVCIPENYSGNLRLLLENDSKASGAEKHVINIGKFSNVNIEMTVLSNGASDENSIQGKSIYINMERGSTMEFNYLQDKGKNISDLTYVRTYMEDDCTAKLFHINHGGRSVIFQTDSEQYGINSDYRVFGASFSSGTQRIDIRDSSLQIGRSTSADIQVRGVVTGKSLTIHRGNVEIEFESQESTGFYDSKILLLSKEGYANSKPGLMIKNSNTRSKHGSAISSVDEDQLVYLESRGIERKEAMKMITSGFIESLLEKSRNQKFKEIVTNYAESLEV
ncbi:SufD family Fe-S cluster assembly protein [Caldiplasma sukawensis]